MSAGISTVGRSDRRRARTRTALIEAARIVFAERGVEAATVQQITDAADVAKGSFYNHFESREDLHLAVAESVLSDLGAALDRDVAQRESDPARVIATSMLSTLRTCFADPALGGFLLQNSSAMNAESAIGRRGRRDLLRGVASGRFLIDDVETAMAAIVGAGQGILRGRLRGELDATAEPRLIALALRMLGLSTEEADTIATESAAAIEGNLE